MEQLCNTVTAILPSIRQWSKNSRNRCACDDLPAYWNAYEVLVFLADVGMYTASMDGGLDGAEQERLGQFKSEYFKKRFVVSRFLIKHILTYIRGTGNRDTVGLSRENKRIVVPGRADLFLSLSYSGNSLALCVGKQKTGIDIEGVRPVHLGKILSSPLFDRSKCGTREEESLHALQVWTLVEAYAKLRERNPFPLLAGSGLLQDARFVSYLADQRSLVSLAYDGGDLDHALFWIDPETFSFWPEQRKPPHSTPPGDPYVRS